MAIDTMELGIDITRPPTIQEGAPEVRKDHVQLVQINMDVPVPTLGLAYPEDEYDTRNLVYQSILNSAEAKKDKRRIETYKHIRRGLQNFKTKDYRDQEDGKRWELTDELKDYADQIMELRSKGDIQLIPYEPDVKPPLVH